MKRIAIIIALMFLAIGASAQISNVRTKAASETIVKFRSGFCSLKHDVDRDVYMLWLSSTNNYDSVPIVYIGQGKESALQTLKDLISLHSSMNKMDHTTFSIDIMGQKKDYSVMKYDNFNFSFLLNTAGSVTLATTEIKKMIHALEGK